MSKSRLVRRIAPLLPWLVLLPAAADAQHAADVVADGAARIDPSAVTDPAMRSLYAKAQWRMLWTAAAADALDTALAARDRHGLDHVRFQPLAAPDATAADRDVARTRTALDYAHALASGRTDPAALHQVYTLPRPKADVAAGLWTALQAGTLATWFDTLAPGDAEYRQLSDAYVRFSRAAAAAPPGPAIAAGLIHVGDTDARVPAVAGQLADSGYLTAPAAEPATTATLYTPAMAEALKALQTDYGIAADGVVGPATLKVLNLGAGDRARALAVALERRRWLARNPAATRIDVNTAAAQLRYYRNGTLVDTRKVVVGEPGRETPPLSSPIYRLVANPTWTVPKSIQNGEMANVGADYLQAHNMVLRDGWIVQQPGPDNALGLVKFDMANDQAIYLHDTSAPALFERSQRHLSHGCVRVEDALGFAQMLAEDEGVTDAWQAAQASGEMTFVPLPTRIPVRLLYHNVFIGDDGAIAFRTDPYGWNDAVAEQLGFARASARRAEAKAIDIGP
ncbi:murein L,D-transpeptidase YcbB/YkuD [Sphingomonas insulae]|uniref:L,D-TPase catalytic domain-containing protein n=2 Tax=Sphingomonas insulae TaxID=424800 RepID=A0ABN1HQE4_9SPHN|nr:L,D-transpeptidase family protein [Sphingomonas insulae]NIJ29410.1 murein L,D-transpeptidase YcbB/YkuD [Sphingomonas insulae]